VELKAQNKYPIGKDKWEVLTTTRIILQNAGILMQNSIIGIEELDSGNKRIHKVEAMEDSKIYFITRDLYLSLFTDIEKDLLRNNVCSSILRVKEIDELHLDEYAVRYKNNAILDAMKLNLPYKGYTENGRCSEFVDKRQKKMFQWLRGLHKNKFTMQHADADSKIIQVMRERKIVNREGDDIDEENN